MYHSLGVQRSHNGVGTESELQSVDYATSALGQLMAMLSQPVVRRSQLLTDRLLRLLGLISVSLPDLVKPVTSGTTDTVTTAPSTTLAVATPTTTTAAISAPLTTVTATTTVSQSVQQENPDQESSQETTRNNNLLIN